MAPTRNTENAVFHNDRLYVRDVWICEPGEVLPIPRSHASFIYNNHTGLVEKSRYFIAPVTSLAVTIERERRALQSVLESAPINDRLVDVMWGASHVLLELRKTNA